MRVFLKFLQPFSSRFKDVELFFSPVEGKITFETFINRLRQEYPQIHGELCSEDGKLQDHVLCVLNDEVIPLDELVRKQLVDGDVITFGYAIGGG